MALPVIFTVSVVITVTVTVTVSITITVATAVATNVAVFSLFLCLLFLKSLHYFVFYCTQH